VDLIIFFYVDFFVCIDRQNILFFVVCVSPHLIALLGLPGYGLLSIQFLIKIID
jgi:hypothetical protein